jgi:hypothetical protein
MSGKELIAAAAKGWAKFQAPSNFIKTEQQTKTMEPTERLTSKFVLDQLDVLIKTTSSKGEKSRYEALRADIQAMQATGEFAEKFIVDFILWILGRSSKNVVYEPDPLDPNGTRARQANDYDAIITPWGNKPYTFLPDVKNFIDSIVDERMNAMKYLTKLKLRWPRNLEELWIWWKYIVHKQGLNGLVVEYARYLEPYDFLPPDELPYVPPAPGSEDPGESRYMYYDQEGDDKVPESQEVEAMTPLNPNPPPYSEEGRAVLRRILANAQAHLSDQSNFKSPGEKAEYIAKTYLEMKGMFGYNMSYEERAEVDAAVYNQIQSIKNRKTREATLKAFGYGFSDIGLSRRLSDTIKFSVKEFIDRDKEESDAYEKARSRKGVPYAGGGGTKPKRGKVTFSGGGGGGYGKAMRFGIPVGGGGGGSGGGKKKEDEKSRIAREQEERQKKRKLTFEQMTKKLQFPSIFNQIDPHEQTNLRSDWDEALVRAYQARQAGKQDFEYMRFLSGSSAQIYKDASRWYMKRLGSEIGNLSEKGSEKHDLFRRAWEAEQKKMHDWLEMKHESWMDGPDDDGQFGETYRDKLAGVEFPVHGAREAKEYALFGFAGSHLGLWERVPKDGFNAFVDMVDKSVDRAALGFSRRVNSVRSMERVLVDAIADLAGDVGIDRETIQREFERVADKVVKGEYTSRQIKEKINAGRLRFNKAEKGDGGGGDKKDPEKKKKEEERGGKKSPEKKKEGVDWESLQEYGYYGPGRRYRGLLPLENREKFRGLIPDKLRRFSAQFANAEGMELAEKIKNIYSLSIKDAATDLIHDGDLLGLSGAFDDEKLDEDMGVEGWYVASLSPEELKQKIEEDKRVLENDIWKDAHDAENKELQEQAKKIREKEERYRKKKIARAVQTIENLAKNDIGEDRWRAGEWWHDRNTVVAFNILKQLEDDEAAEIVGLKDSYLLEKITLGMGGGRKENYYSYKLNPNWLFGNADYKNSFKPKQIEGGKSFIKNLLEYTKNELKPIEGNEIVEWDEGDTEDFDEEEVAGLQFFNVSNTVNDVLRGLSSVGSTVINVANRLIKRGQSELAVIASPKKGETAQKRRDVLNRVDSLDLYHQRKRQNLNRAKEKTDVTIRRSSSSLSEISKAILEEDDKKEKVEQTEDDLVLTELEAGSKLPGAASPKEKLETRKRREAAEAEKNALNQLSNASPDKRGAGTPNPHKISQTVKDAGGQFRKDMIDTRALAKELEIDEGQINQLIGDALTKIEKAGIFESKEEFDRLAPHMVTESIKNTVKEVRLANQADAIETMASKQMQIYFQLAAGDGPRVERQVQRTSRKEERMSNALKTFTSANDAISKEFLKTSNKLLNLRVRIETTRNVLNKSMQNLKGANGRELPEEAAIGLAKKEKYSKMIEELNQLEERVKFRTGEELEEKKELITTLDSIVTSAEIITYRYVKGIMDSIPNTDTYSKFLSQVGPRLKQNTTAQEEKMWEKMTPEEISKIMVSESDKIKSTLLQGANILLSEMMADIEEFRKAVERYRT